MRRIFNPSLSNDDGVNSKSNHIASAIICVLYEACSVTGLVEQAELGNRQQLHPGAWQPRHGAHASTSSSYHFTFKQSMQWWFQTVQNMLYSWKMFYCLWLGPKWFGKVRNDFQYKELKKKKFWKCALFIYRLAVFPSYLSWSFYICRVLESLWRYWSSENRRKE